MARIRSIHPGLFTDDAFMTASPFARLLVIGIWTECWDDGVFEWKPISLKARLFPADNVDVIKLLSEIEGLQFVRQFDVGGKVYGAVRNFRKFQRPKKPNSSGILPNQFRTYVGLDVAGSDAGLDEGANGSEKPPQMEDGGWRGGVEEDDVTSPAPDHRSVRLRKDVTQAFKTARSMTLNPDTHRCEIWMAQGFDPEICIAVVRDVLSRNPNVSTLQYFDQPIAKAHAGKRAAPPEDRGPKVRFSPSVEWPEASVAKQIEHWRRDPSTWPEQILGPAPDREGCRVPGHMLSDAALATTGRTRPIAAE